MIGCSMTSSGMSRLFASATKVGQPPITWKNRQGLHSISAQHGLQPEVSRRRAMYDSRSGMTPVARSDACWVTAWKKKSNVSMNRCWVPADAVRRSRL